MTRFLKIVFCSLFLLLSCSEKNEKVEEKFPVVIDNGIYKSVEMDTTESITSSYKPLYIGDFKDSLKVDYSFQNTYVYGPDWILNDSLKKIKNETEEKYARFFKMNNLLNDHFPDSTEIEIIVDTATIIHNLNWNPYFDSTYAYKAFPVLLKNKTSNDLTLGLGFAIILKMEAKDENGMWRPIEKDLTIDCATGIPSFILPPNEVVLTSAFIYKGDFKTDLRLRMRNSYSNVFKGSINKGQFVTKQY